MLQEMKLVIKENNEVLETVIKETSTKPSFLVQSLQDFQQSVNAALTKMIENRGEAGTMAVEDDEEDSDGDDEDSDGDDEENDRDDDDISASPKKKKK